MNRLLFSTLIFSLFGSPFAVAAEVDAHEVEEIVVIGSKQSKLQGNEHQNLAERMSIFGLGNSHLAESFFYNPGNLANVLSATTPTGRSSGRLVYSDQGDASDTVRSEGSRVGRIGLKLLGGTAGSTVGAIGAVYLLFLTGVWEFCDDNSPEDCGEVTWEEEVAAGVGAIGLYSTGIATGVSVWDRRDRFIYTLAGSLIGLGGGIALVNVTGRFGSSLLVLPVIAATAASEWSRYRPESRRYSIGLRPEPRGGLSVVAALRF